MKRFIEIRAAEGGEDAKLFTADLASAFASFADRMGWKADLAGENPVVVSISGKSVDRLDDASGGYRIQRVPPTEKRGRVHTSTVTVAVMESTAIQSCKIKKSDIRIEWFSGSGAGGQHRNKHQNSCRVIHEPTGIVEARQGRKRESNLREAMQAIEVRVNEQLREKAEVGAARTRKSRVGSGERGDKVLTLRMQDNSVVFHRTGKSTAAKKFMRGDMGILLTP